MIVRTGGYIWLYPFLYVCSVVTVECFITVLRGYVCCYVWKKNTPPVSAIAERRYMGLYEVILSTSMLSFGMRTMLANFHLCAVMLVLRARGHICFRWLMHSLSGSCDLLFLLCFIASWT